jgi:U2 small nuclear ribonucleoprotein B''
MNSKIPPNETLYLSNLNDKISKKDLKRELFHLFSLHGNVIGIIVKKTFKERGQAFVVFKDIPEATLGMRALQGFMLFDKTIKIAYAKTKSNIIRIQQGTILNKNAEKRVLEADDQPTKRLKLDQDESNQLLFVTNLPSGINKQALETLFSQYEGFIEIRGTRGSNPSGTRKVRDLFCRI